MGDHRPRPARHLGPHRRHRLTSAPLGLAPTEPHPNHRKEHHTPTTHPYRVRLHGGRNVHAARHVNGSANRVTACGYYLPDGTDNHWLAATAPVTCRACQRATGGRP